MKTIPKSLLALVLLAVGLTLSGCAGSTPDTIETKVPGPPAGAQPAVAQARPPH